jgi:hypothetical protein
MAESCESAVLYTAVYEDIGMALADLAAFERLHKAELIGKYDAAVVDERDGEPHIVKRVDHPAVRVIPQWLGSGTLARRELHDAARALDTGEAALIVVGEATLAKGVQRAFTRAVKTAKRELDAPAEELAKDLTEAG